MENTTNLILLVLAGSAMMLLLILMIILFVNMYNRKLHQKEHKHEIDLKTKEIEMLRAVFMAQEKEKEKLAANLHDEVGPLLSALKFRMVKFKRDLAKEKLTAEQLDQEQENIDEILENVRTVSHDLTPQFLLKFGLVDALQSFVCKLEKPKFQLLHELPENFQIESHILTNLYRITLELLNNITKHDQATSGSICIDLKENKLDILISHNGDGISTEEFERFAAQSKGLGLESIISRVVLINATLIMNKSTQNELASINLNVPMI